MANAITCAAREYATRRVLRCTAGTRAQVQQIETCQLLLLQRSSSHTAAGRFWCLCYAAHTCQRQELALPAHLRRHQLQPSPWQLLSSSLGPAARQQLVKACPKALAPRPRFQSCSMLWSTSLLSHAVRRCQSETQDSALGRRGTGQATSAAFIILLSTRAVCTYATPWQTPTASSTGKALHHGRHSDELPGLLDTAVACIGVVELPVRRAKTRLLSNR